MNQPNIEDFLNKNVSALLGVGDRLKKLLKKKKIEKISDLLLTFPQGFTDRSNLQTLDKLEIGKITTIKVKAVKYNFPRIRNLPNKVICEDEKGKIDIVFFNSREGYIRKVLPLNSMVIISGKINFFKKKYLQFLIYFGNYHYQKLKQQKILKLKIFKLVKRIISN